MKSDRRASMKGEEGTASGGISWVVSLPACLLYLLVGGYMVSAQWSPADSTSVATGDSILLILFGLAIGFLSSVVLLVERRAAFVSPIPSIVGTLFIGWLAIATYASYGYVNFRTSLLGLWQSVALVGVLQGLVVLFKSSTMHSKLLHWSVALSCGASAYALYQYFVSMPQTRSRFALFKEEMLRDIGLTVGTPEAMQFENRLFSTEPFGPFALTNSLAGTLAPIVVLSGIVLMGAFSKDLRGLLINGGASASRSQVDGKNSTLRSSWIVAWFAILFVTSFVLLLTKSRTAWLAAVVGLGVGGLLVLQMSSRLKMRTVAVVVACTIGLGAIVVGVIAWIDSAIILEAGKSFLYRMEYWQGAWQLALRSPWLGYGPLAFQSEYTTVKSMVASENPADPHNMWMEILVSGGFPLLAISILGAIWLIYRSVMWYWNAPAIREQESWEAPGSFEADDLLEDRLPVRNGAPELLVDAGAMVLLGLILFFGLIVYSVNPKSDLLLNSLVFGIGAALSFWFVRSTEFSDLGRRGASIVMVLVVMIHFMFSGGWMQPGAMSPLIVGLAGIVGWSSNGGRSKIVVEDGAKRLRFLVLIAGWIVAIGFFGVMTLRPERNRGPIAQMQFENRLSEIPAEDYFGILDSSGWDPDPASWLLREVFQRLTDKNLGQASRLRWLEIYKHARRRWLANDPRNWLVASQVSIMDASVIEACKTAGFDPVGFLEMNDVIAATGRATKLNPSSASCHLQTAVFLYWAQDIEAAKASLEMAEKIDRTTPHADRKISVCSVWVPVELVRGAPQSLQVSQTAGMSGFFKGEPVFSWLRKVIP